MSPVFIFLTFVYACANTEIVFEEPPISDHLTITLSCLHSIMEANNIKELVYNNLNEENEALLKNIHSINATAFLRAGTNTLNSRLTQSMAHFIYLNADQIVFNNLRNILDENYRKPDLKFIIVVKRLKESHLKNTFDVFLKQHIHNVIIINGTNTAELYGYNAFENNACGKYYTRIIRYGTCNQELNNLKNLYPEKLTNLKRCNFRVIIPIIPNATINNTQIVRSATLIFKIEEYVFSLMSKAGQFNYSVMLKNVHEEYGLYHRNVSMPGAFRMLQDNTSDIIVAGLYLTIPRTEKFSFIRGYLDFVDDLRIVVRRAQKLPQWQDFFLEFTPLVWFLLFLIFLLYSIIIILVLKPVDKGRVVMLLLDNLLQHGAKFQKNTTADVFLITWVWFVYLISCFYTCSLMSLTTKPGFGYQINNLDDLKRFNVKPRFSTLVAEIGKDLFGDIDGIIPKNQNDNKISVSAYDVLEKVNKTYDLFTIVSQFGYGYYEDYFLDEYGSPFLYMFDKSCHKTIYSFYLNKGFPMTDRLNSLALKARESGLVSQKIKEIMNSHKLKINTKFKIYKSRFVFPWLLFWSGVTASCFVLMVEIALHKLQNNVKLDKINKN